jgi:hypothetical protein
MNDRILVIGGTRGTGFLTNAQAGSSPIEISQDNYPLSLRYRIARADVAEVFVQALKHYKTARTTFEIAWARRTRRKP